MKSNNTTTKETLAVIEWIDARVNIDGDIPVCPLMTSVGWIIHRDKKTTIVVSLKSETGEPRITTAIPSSLVRKIKKLK